MSLINPRAQSSMQPVAVSCAEIQIELVVEEVVVDRLGGGVAVDDLVVGEAGHHVQPDETLRVMSPHAPEVVMPTFSRRVRADLPGAFVPA